MTLAQRHHSHQLSTVPAHSFYHRGMGFNCNAMEGWEAMEGSSGDMGDLVHPRRWWCWGSPQGDQLTCGMERQDGERLLAEGCEESCGSG